MKHNSLLCVSLFFFCKVSYGYRFSDLETIRTYSDHEMIGLNFKDSDFDPSDLENLLPSESDGF